jgi:cobalt-zinc-cadmium efflux system membrane fusion protein
MNDQLQTMESAEPQAPTPDAGLSSAAAAAPPRRNGLRRWLLHAIPNLLVLLVLAAIAYWGHSLNWKLPSFADLTGGEANEREGWCAEHDVPGLLCVECNPELYPKLVDYGFCEYHGVHNCPIHHPEISQLQESDELVFPDEDVISRALALKPRTENNPGCPLYRRRVQLASVDVMTSSGMDVSRALMRPMVEFIAANGEITYDKTQVTHVSSPVAGKLRRIEKIEGSIIRRGDVLLLVDSAEVGQAKADYLQALSAVEQARKLRSNIQALIEQGVYRAGASQDVDTNAAVRSSEVALVKAEQTMLNLGLAVPTAELVGLQVSEIADRIRFLGIPADIVEALDPGTSTANLLPVRAYHDGILTQREMVEGEVVERNDTILVYADVDRMWANLSLRQDDAKYVELAQSVKFLPDGDTEPVSGRITWISTAADEKSRTVQARAELDNPGGRLKAGMFGLGQVILRDEPNTVTVESESVHWDGSCNVVFVRDKDFFKDDVSRLFHTRTVRVGAKDGVYTEIIAGILPGEVVATKGSGILMAAVLKNNLGAG